MLTFWLGLIGSIVALVGWFAFHSPLALLLGTAGYLAEVWLERKRNGFNDRAPDLVFFAFGCIAGFMIPGMPWYFCGMIVANVYNLYMTLLAMFMQLF